MNMQPGEVVDKWTILRMKLRAQPENNSVLGLCIAHGTASEQILSLGDPNLLDLVELNAKIWQLESLSRKLRVPAMYPLVAELAKEILALNSLRMKAVERINLQVELERGEVEKEDADRMHKLMGELNAKAEESQDGADQVQ